MTNRELLQTPKELLGEVDKQRQYLLRVEGTPMPCPACKSVANAFDAAGIEVDAYDLGKTSYSYCCPACGAVLEQVLPVFPGGGQPWHWQLQQAWLQEQLAKARAFDKQQPPNLPSPRQVDP
jgi:hypothetical protein